MTSIPRASLNALRALEAAVRLKSMTAASSELGVTHGAVSRHVRSLEDVFGLPLFRRSGQNIEPTSEAARLAEQLSLAFNIINAGIGQLRPGPLTLSCSATMMMYWLLPRIASFQSANPHIELQFNTNHDRVDFVHDKVSIAIRNNKIVPPKDVITRPLMTEWIGPVCSPEYLRSSGLSSKLDLSNLKLLATRTRMNAWEEWLGVVGSEDAPLIPQEYFEHFYLLIQAAVCNLGIAVVPQMLVLGDLQSGKLIAPFGFVPGPRELSLWIAPHLAARPDTKALANWLSGEMKRTLAEQGAARMLAQNGSGSEPTKERAS